MLPNEVLLYIFDFHVINQGWYDIPGPKKETESWIPLAHVCRRWRSVIFQSPLCLNLRLVCTSKTRVDMLDTWPPLPLIIRDLNYRRERPEMDNIIAALEHNDRVCQIELRLLTRSEFEYLTSSAAMQKPFPELTDIYIDIDIYRHDRPELILPRADPDSELFLGGSAPRLRRLLLDGFSFPGLPKRLLSTPHLVDLYLNIPSSGYIPPEAMATILSALTNLESLGLIFQHPRPRPALEIRRPPPPPQTRTILPNLTIIQFKGASEYLEGILARIDAPRLDNLNINFFNQIIFDLPQLLQFISRRPMLWAAKEGRITIFSGTISIGFRSQTYGLTLGISCTASEWQLSSLEQVCTSSLPPLSALEDLYIFEFLLDPPHWQDDVENTLWLDLLHPFAAVKNLNISKRFVPRIAFALQELVGPRTTEVLPTLENIFLEGLSPSGPLQKGIEKFVAARQLTSHPVAVSRWERG